MASNKVKFGLEEVYYAKATKAEDGIINYEKPVAINGAVSLSLDNNAEATNFYADDKIYFTALGAKSYSGTLTMALVPDSFKIDIMGQHKDANGALIESEDDTFSPFALMFSVKGDQHKRRTVLYNNTVTAPSIGSQTTEDSTEVQTEELNITSSARETDGKVQATLELNDSNATQFNSFFESVYEEETTV